MIQRFLLTACVSLAISALSAKEYDVTVNNADITLAGTLSAPDSGSPKAAIVLITGSGAQNRDEEILNFRPFKVLSDSLSAAGYAVLRMDDRGVGGSGGDSETAVISDQMGDIASALSFLDSSYKDIPKGVIGHSLGGAVAIKLAANDKASRRPDFMVTLAAPAWTGDSILMSQSRAVALALLGSWPIEGLQRQLISIAKGDFPEYLAKAAMMTTLNQELGSSMQLPQVQEQFNQQLGELLSPWFRDMLRYDPSEDMPKINIPWLAINGEKDMQVMPENLATIAEANPSVTICALPDHNHLFQIADRGMPQEYFALGQSPSSATIEAIISWLNSNIK